MNRLFFISLSIYLIAVIIIILFLIFKTNPNGDDKKKTKVICKENHFIQNGVCNPFSSKCGNNEYITRDGKIPTDGTATTDNIICNPFSSTCGNNEYITRDRKIPTDGTATTDNIICKQMGCRENEYIYYLNENILKDGTATENNVTCKQFSSKCSDNQKIIEDEDIPKDGTATKNNRICGSTTYGTLTCSENQFKDGNVCRPFSECNFNEYRNENKIKVQTKKGPQVVISYNDIPTDGTATTDKYTCKKMGCSDDEYISLKKEGILKDGTATENNVECKQMGKCDKNHYITGEKDGIPTDGTSTENNVTCKKLSKCPSDKIYQNCRKYNNTGTATTDFNTEYCSSEEEKDWQNKKWSNCHE